VTLHLENFYISALLRTYYWMEGLLARLGWIADSSPLHGLGPSVLFFPTTFSSAIRQSAAGQQQHMTILFRPIGQIHRSLELNLCTPTVVEYAGGVGSTGCWHMLITDTDCPVVCASCSYLYLAAFKCMRACTVCDLVLGGNMKIVIASSRTNKCHENQFNFYRI